MQAERRVVDQVRDRDGVAPAVLALDAPGRAVRGQERVHRRVGVEASERSARRDRFRERGELEERGRGDWRPARDVGEAGVDRFDLSAIDHCRLHACHAVALQELRCGVLELSAASTARERLAACAAQRSQCCTREHHCWFSECMQRLSVKRESTGQEARSTRSK